MKYFKKTIENPNFQENWRSSIKNNPILKRYLVGS